LAAWNVILFRSYLKKAFWPNLGVGTSSQVLDILEYACGLRLGPALILNQNPFFEMASSKVSQNTIIEITSGGFLPVLISPIAGSLIYPPDRNKN
jgi:hypothetical protein